MSKVCSKCKQEKDLSEFFKRTASKDGYRSECKTCQYQCSLKSKKKECNFCGEPCWGKKGRCEKCKQKHSFENYSTLTLGDKTYTKHKFAKYAYVRWYAKKQALELGWNKCCVCGYDKHFEVAHKKPISEFPPETLLIDINHPDNLLPLCPNCHYEFDNGLLNLSDAGETRTHDL